MVKLLARKWAAHSGRKGMPSVSGSTNLNFNFDNEVVGRLCTKTFLYGQVVGMHLLFWRRSVPICVTDDSFSVRWTENPTAGVAAVRLPIIDTANSDFAFTTSSNSFYFDPVPVDVADCDQNVLLTRIREISADHGQSVAQRCFGLFSQIIRLADQSTRLSFEQFGLVQQDKNSAGGNDGCNPSAGRGDPFTRAVHFIRLTEGVSDNRVIDQPSRQVACQPASCEGKHCPANRSKDFHSAIFTFSTLNTTGARCRSTGLARAAA